MILFSRRNLHYSDYKWSTYAHNDPKVNGKPDATQFDRAEGNEMVYLINKLMILFGIIALPTPAIKSKG